MMQTKLKHFLMDFEDPQLFKRSVNKSGIIFHPNILSQGKIHKKSSTNPKN